MLGDTKLVDEPCDVAIKGAVAYCTWPDGERRAVPLDVFRTNIARCQRALEEFDAKRGVIQLKSAPPRHG